MDKATVNFFGSELKQSEEMVCLGIKFSRTDPKAHTNGDEVGAGRWMPCSVPGCFVSCSMRDQRPMM